MKSRYSSAGSLRARLFIEQLEARQLLSGVQPTAAEQLLLYDLNQIRANPAAYGASIGINLSGVAPTQPLALSVLATAAASGHAQDMNNQGYIGQTSPQGVDPGSRLTQAGVTWLSWGESSAGGSAYTTPASALQALITDSSSPTLADRNLLLAIGAQYQTQAIAGVGIVQNGTGPLTNYYTIDTAQIGSSNPFITGVVFVNNDGSGKYQIGEGLGGVALTITGTGAPITTATYSSGGYSQQLAPGTYTVTASGGGLISPVSQTVTVTTSNVEVDFALPPGQVQPQQAAWIGLLYRDLLGRVPTSGEIANWVGDLQSGATQAAIANGFLYSAEYSQLLVSGWYQLYLKRTPDASGLAGFSTALTQGASEDSIRADLLGSVEFYQLSGNTPGSFVTAIYQDVLNRTPSAAEMAGWVSMVASGNNMGVVDGILSSPEARTIDVQSIYQKFLRRNADAGGLNLFVSQLQNGADERAALNNILVSTEYYNQSGNIIWLQSLYENVLGRNGDSVSQLGSWLAALGGGESRSGVAIAFLNSPEYAGDRVTALYNQLLNRSPDSAGLSIFVAQVESTGLSINVIEAIASSPEFYGNQGGTNTNWIMGLYRDLLGRNPAQSEVNYWLGVLSQGRSRLQVVTGIVTSTEYQTDTVDSLFSQYLERTPTPVELAQYVSQIQSGVFDANVIGGLLASNAYYSQVTG